MVNSFSRFRVLNFVEDTNLSVLREKLDETGYFVFDLEGKEIKDAESFFANIKDVLPQDPPLSEKVNWDAFVDSIWGGLDNLKKEKVAIIWTNFDKMLERGLPDLVMAIDCFFNLARSISDPKTGIQIPVSLIFFFTGKGANFETGLFEEYK